MSALRKAGAAVAVAGGMLAVITTIANPAYAGGAPSPFSGRSEGGSLIVKSGDVIACAAAGKEDVVDTKGTVHHSDGAGANFTTPAGAEFETLSGGSLEVTFQGASATVTCPSSLVPATAAFVPKSTLAGAGSSVIGGNTVETVAGGALAAVGIAGGAILLGRRRVGGAA